VSQIIRQPNVLYALLPYTVTYTGVVVGIANPNYQLFTAVKKGRFLRQNSTLMI